MDRFWCSAVGFCVDGVGNLDRDVYIEGDGGFSCLWRLPSQLKKHTPERDGADWHGIFTTTALALAKTSAMGYRRKDFHSISSVLLCRIQGDIRLLKDICN
jgi:hypothetical protein